MSRGLSVSEQKVWRILVQVPLFLLAVAASSPAAADEKATCLSSYVQVQALRQDGKLLAAHAAGITCARDVCPAQLRADCAQWVSELDATTPSVVLSATGPDGNDETEVVVSSNGHIVSMRLDGHSVSLDPGDHVFRFSLRDGETKEERLLIKQGEHDRPVHVDFPRRAPLPPATEPSAVAPPSRPIPPLVYVTGAGALAGLGLSAFFGAEGIWGKPGIDTLHGCMGHCAQADVNTVSHEFVASDVALGVGVAAAIVSGVLFFTRPRVRAPSSSSAFVFGPATVGIALP